MSATVTPTHALVENVEGGEGFRYFALGLPDRLERRRAALEHELGLPLLVVRLP